VRQASSRSPNGRIERAARQLQGQSLCRVSVDGARGRSRFEFDYGGVMETARMKKTDIQWILHDPKEAVLEVRGDGKYRYAAESTPGSWFASG
jgi:hypothetical protein